MLDGLRQFIADIVAPMRDPDFAFDDTGYLLAATALLVHVVSLDGEPSAIEKRKLHSLIESRFKLDPGTADHLIAQATRAEGEAVDLYRFTSVIMRSVNEEGRLRIIEMMWETGLRRRPGQRVRGQRGLACGRSARHFIARPDRSQAQGGGAAATAASGEMFRNGRRGDCDSARRTLRMHVVQMTKL